MKIKEIYTKLKNEFYREDVFWENEIKANQFVAGVLLNLAFVMALTLGLVLCGVVENPAGVSFMYLHMITLPLIVLSVILCWCFKGEKHWIKYLLCIVCLTSVVAMNAVINYRTTLVLAIPLLVSCRYYDKKLTKIIMLLTFVGLYISEYIYAVNGPFDLNSLASFGGNVVPSSDSFSVTMPDAGFDLSTYMGYRIKASVMPKTFFLVVISLACIALVKAVRMMVLSQEQITMKNTRIEMELSTAGTIQANMIPCTFPMFPERDEFDVYASMTPAKAVGGDFYDMFLIDDDHLALVMADVSDKGIPAALFMMVSKILINDLAMEHKSPADVLYEMNNRLCAHNETEMFVTVWLGFYEISTGKLVASNAGHEYPVLKRKDGNYEIIKDKHGLVVAGVEDYEYENYEMMLHEGDELFIYTDGVAEANNTEGKMYGMERMLEDLNEDPEREPEQVIQDMHRAIDRFAGKADQFDDITMLSFQVKKIGNRKMAKTKNAEVKERLEKTWELSVKNDMPHVITENVEEELQKVLTEDEQSFIAKFNIAIDELCSNVLFYSEASTITAKLTIDDASISLQFRDNGKPYDILSVEDPDETLAMDEDSLGGYGIFMVKQLMDKVEYEYINTQNVVTITKNR